MKKTRALVIMLLCLAFVLCFSACNHETKTKDGIVTVYLKNPITKVLFKADGGPVDGIPYTFNAPNGVVDAQFLSRNGIDPTAVLGVEFDGNVKEIQKDAFVGCTELMNNPVRIPGTVQVLSKEAFPPEVIVYSDTEEIAGKINEDVKYPVTVTVKNVYGTTEYEATTEDVIETYNGVDIKAKIKELAKEVKGYDAVAPIYDHDVEEKVLAEKDLVITISWTANTYNVHFIWDGLERAYLTDVAYDVLTEVPDVGFDVPGYHIDGWLNGEEEIVLNEDNEFVALTKTDEDEVYLTLKKAPNEYTVHYQYGDVVSETVSTYAYNEKNFNLPNLPEDLEVPEGKHFIGWAKSESATTPDYRKDSTVKEPICKDSEITLYPVWKINEYRILVFNKEEKQLYTSLRTYEYGEDFSELITICKGWYSNPDSGYKFVGLSESKPDPEATVIKVDYSENRTILNTTKEGGDLNLYVVTAPKTYTITFNGNGADNEFDNGKELMAPQTMTYGTELSVSKNIYTRDHYSFGGWYTDWDKKNQVPKKLYQYDDNGELKVPMIEGYLDAELKAYWIPDTYTIKFDSNLEDDVTVDGEMEDLSYTYEKSESLRLSDNGFRVMASATQTPQVFVGWSLVESPEEGGDHIFEDASEAKEVIAAEIVRLAALEEPQHLDDGATITLYANWASAYTVVLNIAGGDVGPGSQEVELATFEAPFDKDVALPAYSTYEDNFKDTGYKIVGWTDKKVEGSKVSDDSINCSESDVLNNQYFVYANVVPITYKVELRTNSGNFIKTLSNVNFEDDLTNLLMLGGASKGVKGHHIVGWSLNKNASTAKYPEADGTSVKGLTKEEGKTVTLYEVDAPNEFTITVYKNDGSKDLESKDAAVTKTVKYGETLFVKAELQDHQDEGDDASDDYRLVGFSRTQKDTSVEIGTLNQLWEKDVVAKDGLFDELLNGDEITLYEKWAVKLTFDKPEGYGWKSSLLNPEGKYFMIGTEITCTTHKSEGSSDKYSFAQFEINRSSYHLQKQTCTKERGEWKNNPDELVITPTPTDNKITITEPTKITVTVDSAE